MAAVTDALSTEKKHVCRSHLFWEKFVVCFYFVVGFVCLFGFPSFPKGKKPRLSPSPRLSASHPATSSTAWCEQSKEERCGGTVVLDGQDGAGSPRNPEESSPLVHMAWKERKQEA